MATNSTVAQWPLQEPDATKGPEAPLTLSRLLQRCVLDLLEEARLDLHRRGFGGEHAFHLGEWIDRLLRDFIDTVLAG